MLTEDPGPGVSHLDSRPPGYLAFTAHLVVLLVLFIAPVCANNLYRENVSVPVLQGSYIQIHPVGTRQSGEKITITATTGSSCGQSGAVRGAFRCYSYPEKPDRGIQWCNRGRNRVFRPGR